MDSKVAHGTAAQRHATRRTAEMGADIETFLCNPVADANPGKGGYSHRMCEKKTTRDIERERTKRMMEKESAYGPVRQAEKHHRMGVPSEPTALGLAHDVLEVPSPVTLTPVLRLGLVQLDPQPSRGGLRFFKGLLGRLQLLPRRRLRRSRLGEGVPRVLLCGTCVRDFFAELP